MKTHKSTKALVTLLVIIMVIILANNYLQNSSLNGNSNPAAVSRSVTTSQNSLFSRIKGWFAPGKASNMILPPHRSVTEDDYPIGCWGGHDIENQMFPTVNDCLDWVRSEQLDCDNCCDGRYGPNGNTPDVDKDFNCSVECANSARNARNYCCSLVPGNTVPECGGAPGRSKVLQPF